MVCDLDDDSKQVLCDRVMYRMIYRDYGNIFGSFADSSDLPVPEIAKSDNLYKCRKLPIEDVDIKMPMYWCKARRFNKRWRPSDLGPKKAHEESSSDSNSDSNSDSSSDSVDESLEQRVIDGFFLAGSRYDERRVYVFRPPYYPGEDHSTVKMRLQMGRLRQQNE